jgi:drug/metabolite transporter (DMT)-like permease
MAIGQGLVFLAVALQSSGKVLYGTFLAGLSTPLFILLSICLTATVCLAVARFRLPREGRLQLVLVNLWTAISVVAFFFALDHLAPAMVASIEIGMSLLVAMALVSLQGRAWPKWIHLLACLGIVAGCALLGWAEIAASLSHPDPALVWAAVAASTATGIASALSATASRKLAAAGWRPASVLAHRFHLTIAVAILWLSVEAPAVALPDAYSLLLMAVIGMVGVLAPLLFQIALRRINELTLMVCLAGQPILSFLISLASPAYGWNTVTLLGVLIITLFVALDILAKRRRAEASRA